MVVKWKRLDKGDYEGLGEHYKFRATKREKMGKWMLAKEDPSGRLIVVGIFPLLKGCAEHAESMEASI